MDRPMAVMRGRVGGAPQGAVGESFGGDADEDGYRDAAEEHGRQGEGE